MGFELLEALRQLEREKRIEPDTILEALKAALVSAYKRNYGAEADVRIDIDPESGEIKVFSIESVEGEEEGAESAGEGAESAGVETEVTPKDFGRIAAQTAKQVILQRLREAEREIMYDEYIDREGDIVTGIVEQSDQRYTLINLGRVEALLPSQEQVPTERYDHGTRLKAYIVEVRKTTKEPQIVVSRTHPGLLRRLFELEVPEIYDGFVEIKAVAREPGQRSKVAVASRNPSVDPVGACVGPKGSRVRMVVSELRGEKIDIVQWEEDPASFVASSLSPAKVVKVNIGEESRGAEAIVPDNQLSLAIGKEGQNARLAARLTGWRIDIKSEQQAAAAGEGAAEGEEPSEAELGKCEAITAKGTRCKYKAVDGSRYCTRHRKILEEAESGKDSDD